MSPSLFFLNGYAGGFRLDYCPYLGLTSAVAVGPSGRVFTYIYNYEFDCRGKNTLGSEFRAFWRRSVQTCAERNFAICNVSRQRKACFFT